MTAASVGAASFVAPLYIFEVSPPKVRGGLVSFNRLAVASGILIVYIVNFLFKDVTNNWRWMLGLAALPGAALAIWMRSVPHTPRNAMDVAGASQSMIGADAPSPVHHRR